MFLQFFHYYKFLFLRKNVYFRKTLIVSNNISGRRRALDDEAAPSHQSCLGSAGRQILDSADHTVVR